jgi:hypothetical protein
MSSFKPIVLGLGLVAAVAISAHAQTVAVTPGPSVASLPAAEQGPRVSSHNFVQGDQMQTVPPSQVYPGPAAGASTGIMPPHYEKSADWDNNTALHPYTSNLGPKAH